MRESMHVTIARCIVRNDGALTLEVGFVFACFFGESVDRGRRHVLL